MMRTPLGDDRYKLSDRCEWPGCGRVLTMTAYCKQGLGLASQRLRQNMASHVAAHERGTSRHQRAVATIFRRAENRTLDSFAGCA